ncbi:MAG TPA: hypothetical protein VMH23_03455 [Bacteroidota bacterium]|nr:hypothetical protein [Bacteroidota bacterium]
MLIDIVQVKSFVSTNLPALRKTQQIATELNYPLDKLKRSFYKSERVSLSRYIREFRVGRIKERLLTSDAPCKVICLELGVREDVGARLFKSSTGMTMEEFRKAYFGAMPKVWMMDRFDHRDQNRGLRLVITENEIRKALGRPTTKETHQPTPQSNEAWIQGRAH